jgi:hypothetical protein
MHTQANDDYVPFGDEWRREMMRWRKADLVEFLRRQLIVLNDLQQEQRGAARWRDPKAELPEPLDRVLLVVERDTDGLEGFAVGSCDAAWRKKDDRQWALASGHSMRGRVIGWLPMDEAVQALGLPVFGEAQS